MPQAPVMVVGPVREGQVVWTCEHASGHVPEWVSISPDERAWLRTHWGQDRGAAALTKALQHRLGGPAILAGFSRLVADANRPPDHADLCRTHVDGVALELNRAVTASERQRRVAELYLPYHRAIDGVLDERAAAGVPTLLFSVHAFTSLYEGQPRTVDLGVLFDETDDGAAARMADHLRSGTGLEVALNAPWSGFDGLVYSVARHGARNGVPYLEIEVRDDLLTGPDTGGPLDPVPTDAPSIDRIADAIAQSLLPLLAAVCRVPTVPSGAR